MTTSNDKDMQQRLEGAKMLFGPLFAEILLQESVNIEIRAIGKDNHSQISSTFHNSIESAALKAIELSQDYEVYFGVNPRVGQKGSQEGIHYLVAFHIDIDCGTEGHKKTSFLKSTDEALKNINNFPLMPTAIVASGGGLHCYWVLKQYIEVSKVGIDTLKGINKSLAFNLHGDLSTSDISRILRVPGTYNYKLKDNPRCVYLIELHKEVLYSFDDFRQYIIKEPIISKASGNKKTNKLSNQTNSYLIPDIFDYPMPMQKSITQDQNICIDIATLNVSEKIKNLIRYGNDDTYKSRSEVDMAVIIALFKGGYTDQTIWSIYSDNNLKVGEKYRGHNNPIMYLNKTILSAKDRINLTEEELLNPLFINGILIKKDNKYHLNVLNLQIYTTKKYNMRFVDGRFFIYKDSYYKLLNLDGINLMCQQELKGYRHLFKNEMLNQYIHYAKGDESLNSKLTEQDQARYLNLQNGIYDLEEDRLIEHTPNLFSTNQLPYNYDPQAQCPFFIGFLIKSLNNDTETILFLQEMVGYIFYRDIPKAELVFLIGGGSNGKSVLLDILTKLVGEDNCCNIGLHQFSYENYIYELFDKMLNVVFETPRKGINFDLVKAVVAGDWVTGRLVYEKPFKFKPKTKHLIAMNEMPEINDSSYGLQRRINIIEFTVTFTEYGRDNTFVADPMIGKKLETELSGIFNWALEGLRRLKSNNFVFTRSASMEKTKEFYLNRHNSSRAFIQECLVRSKNDKNMLFSSLYDTYQSYCFNHGYKEIDCKSVFKKKLQQYGFVVSNSTKDNNQLTVFNVELTGQMI